jgi:predicted permease
VSAGYFALLGVQPAIGRTFRPDEDEVPDRNPVAIISDALWRERFGADPAIFERTIHLNDRAVAIVGVMPRGFAGISFDTDVWVPSMMVTLTSSPSVVQSRGTRWLLSVGRLASGVTLDRAREDLARVASLLEGRHPETNRERGVQVDLLREALLDGRGPMVKALFAGVVLFLLVACANVAGLQFARASGRRREIAVRVALGAQRRHVLRQLLTESIVLALAAGTAGTIAAAWALGALVTMMPAGALPAYVDPVIDPRAIAFALAVSLAGGLLIAVVPSIAATRGDMAGAMKEGARSAGPGLGSIRRPSTQQTLVIAEMALAMTLLASAALMVRSLEQQMNVTLGFEPGGVTAARLTLPAARYAPAERIAFAERLVERLRTESVVANATVATTLPFTGNWSASVMIPEGATDETAGQRYYRNLVTPDFFATLGISLLRGRTFTADDRAGTPLVAIINASAARRLWGTEDVVGRRFYMGTPQGPAVAIVGVAADARFRDITTDLTASRVEPDVYFPFAQRSDRDIEVAVQTRDGSAFPPTQFQQAVSAVDGSLPLYRVQGIQDAVRQQTSAARFSSVLLAIFSGGALLLAAVGLYSLVAYVVGLSRREIGIRLALGADARQVVLMIVGNGLALVVIGIALGTAGAIVAGRALEAQLFQTTPMQPATFAAVAALLTGIAVLASLIPSARAVRVDPHSALRAD